MTAIQGTLLVLVLLAAVVAGLYYSWRRPFLGLGFLVAGMAFHNFALMVLLKLGTPGLLIRVFQAWKEAILTTLAVLALMNLLRLWRSGRRLRLLAADWLAVAFTILVCVYFVIPQHWLGGQSNLAERLVAFRAAIFMPLLYILGRAFADRADERDLRWVVWLVVGAAAVVGAFGMIELFLLPTRIWVDWGENLFNNLLGLNYNGPGHLPDNFFQTISGGGLLLRRMVSTYISPLGIAYTGVMVVPVAVVLVEWARRQHRWVLGLAALALTLLLLGILFSVTRLAIGCLVVEVVILAALLKERWLAGLTVVLLAASVVILFLYPKFGPVVDRNLNPASLNYKGAIISANDPSTQEHTLFLIGDANTAVHHPLGVGLGSAVFRYGTTTRSGESAVLSIFVDMGLLGGFVYLAMYLFGLFHGYRLCRSLDRRSLVAALPLAISVGGLALFPITMTSDIWGASAVTYLFWWAAGHCASLAGGRGAASREAAGPLERPG